MKRTLALAALLAAVVYIAPLNVRPLALPDETRYAEIPREMLVSGDWVVPRLNGLRYFEKPVLGYWTNALSMRIFGQNAFANRLPSALAALGAAGLLLFLVRRHGGGSAHTPLLTAAIFLTCFEVYGIGVFNVLDGLFAFFVTATLVAFYEAYTATTPRQRYLGLSAAGAACGLAFLTKGFLAFALPAAAIVPFLLWERRPRELFRLPWIPLGVAILVVLPWALAIHLREPDYWRWFVYHEHLQRFFEKGGAAQHAKPFYFFVPILLGGAFPWTPLVPAAALGFHRRPDRSPLARFAVCWLAFPFLLLSCSSGKLGTYILPCFPPLAILLADGLRRYFDGPGRRAFAIGACLAAGLPAVAGVALLVAQTTALIPFRPYGNGETWKWIGMTAGLLPAALLPALLAMRRTFQHQPPWLYAVAPLPLFLLAHFCLPYTVSGDARALDAVAVMTRQRDMIDRYAPLAVQSYYVPAACWAYRRDDIYVFDTRGELRYGLNYPDARGRMIDSTHFADFVSKHAAPGSPVTCFATRRRFAARHAVLPRPQHLDDNDGYITARYVGCITQSVTENP